MLLISFVLNAHLLSLLASKQILALKHNREHCLLKHRFADKNFDNYWTNVVVVNVVIAVAAGTVKDSDLAFTIRL